MQYLDHISEATQDILLFQNFIFLLIILVNLIYKIFVFMLSPFTKSEKGLKKDKFL
jgi:hypothetical protein